MNDSVDDGGDGQDNYILPSNDLDKSIQNNDVLTGSQSGVNDSFNFESQIASLPQEANDVDLIEKEWVTHLKHIVDTYSDNPFRLQQEISMAKADYMKKRYSRDIKVREG